MVDADKVAADGVKLLEEFSAKLKDVPESGETHYVLDIRNVWRPDGPPKPCEGFRDRLAKLVPKFEDGYVVCEKGE
jgi:predicted Asp-tRNA(Asn)/Glu-tRNA(Gln) amidotransferase subunit C